ncbi:MAG TPA: peptidoglycan-binding domain-containing protein, partial [Candidatus Paceibacterota bacterium]|nr:peptidoglycan-binding domain-containing protein [Candidatus Paceibacterota bacterium]
KTLYAWTKDAAGNISAAATGSVTITISSGGGGGGGTTSGSSGGGGGGTAGGSGLTPLAPAATTTSFTLPMKKLVYPAQYQFARTLSLGSLGVDVKALQEFLNVNGYYVSTSGLGAPGFETTYFGPATDAALKKFQCAMILICTGDPGSSGYGATGSFTRMILNGAIVPIVATPASATAIPSLPVKNTLPTNVGGTVSSYLYLGATGQQVKALQQMLNAKGYTVALSGAGSPGNETAYFGPATSLALKKFQCAMISVCSGGPLVNGYGATGPRTRAALAGTVIPSTTSIAPKTQAPVPKTTASAPVKTTPITQPKPVVVPTIDFGF